MRERLPITRERLPITRERLPIKRERLPIRRNPIFFDLPAILLKYFNLRFSL
jgi:hypothetical protein